MERLTERTVAGVANLKYDKCIFRDGTKDQIACSAYRQRAIERLAAYEDTGLTPEEIAANMEMFAAYRHVCGGLAPDEVEKLIKAQQDGRQPLQTTYHHRAIDSESCHRPAPRIGAYRLRQTQGRDAQPG